MWCHTSPLYCAIQCKCYEIQFAVAKQFFSLNNQVMEEIAAMEQNIAMLKKAIANKEAPMKVSQTRLDNRTFRPNVELCRDRVQYRLIEEVFEISTNIERLQEKLADAEASLKGLIRKQLSLEEDIEMKANSLFIDQDQCMELRKQINHVPH